jgi:ferrous iron transport protein B
VNEQLEGSYIGRLGRFIEPAIEPLGYNWQAGISILTGMAAKEIVLSSMGVIYQFDPDADLNKPHSLKHKLEDQQAFTPLTAYSFMVFVLLYFPCVAALAAIRRESGLRWALFTAFYTTGIAWIVAFGIYQVGGLF